MSAMNAIKHAVKQTLDKALTPYYYRDAVRRLKDLEETCRREKRDPFQVPFDYRGSGIYRVISPSQHPDEVRQLYDRVRSINPRFVCEIGTDKGGTFYLWCKAAADDAVVISVDLPSRGNYSDSRRRLYNHFKRDERQTLHFVASDSHQPSTVDTIKDLTGNRPLDFLFIDGDHTYEGALQDYEMYSPLVRKGGLIAFHDIRTVRENCGVPRVWEEVKPRHEVWEEFTTPGAEGPTGGGIALAVQG